MSVAAYAAPVSGEERVARLLGDVRIRSRGAFRIGDGPALPVGPARPRALDPDGSAALRDGLAAALYAAAYARVYRGPGFDPASVNRAASPDPAFLSRLDAANPSRDAWEPGWRVFARDRDGSVHAAKGDNAVRLVPGRFAQLGQPRPTAVGDVVARWRERGSVAHQPGFYHAFGEAPPSDYDQARIARLYFDAAPSAAEWLLGQVASVLNRFGIPFWFKCPVSPDLFERLDAAVLYVARRHLPAVASLLGPLAGDFERRLRGATPLWTLPLFSGVGAADDPGTGESFGQSRCALFAAGIVDAWAAGRDDAEGRRAAVAARFGAAGLDAARPHLAPGLVDVYAAASRGGPS